jgi:hypothetical protein
MSIQLANPQIPISIIIAGMASPSMIRMILIGNTVRLMPTKGKSEKARDNPIQKAAYGIPAEAYKILLVISQMNRRKNMSNNTDRVIRLIFLVWAPTKELSSGM